MTSDLLRALGGVIGGLLLLAVIGVVWLGSVMAWGERRTRGMAYYGLGPADRERFRRRLRFHARLLAPLIRLVARVSPFDFGKASFEVQGVAGPRGTCTAESFRAGTSYDPTRQDVFVVTQMRSGTTWMQYLVYEILTRGEGDLVESGRTLNAVSPWLESLIGVPVRAAPLLGPEPSSRVIKTHFPVDLCPFSPEARYIYLVRHPASCFASCVDFLADNLGPSNPPLHEVEAWFCSHERMWWGSWPRHVEGWWTRSLQESNVLFVRFESMVADLPGVVADVTSFLGRPRLGEQATRTVCDRAGFAYMKEHKTAFEMYPPHLLAADGTYFAKGTVDRYRDVPATVQARVVDWCRHELTPGSFPFTDIYSVGTATSSDDPRAREDAR